MLDRLRERKPVQLALGLAMGVCFGFLLDKGGVTRYEVILGQLLLRDFTVLKVMLTAIVVGMAGVHWLHGRGLVVIPRKPAALGSNVLGGLLFGLGFGVLGYCPGTMAGAAGRGALDALLAGVPGMLLGAWMFAVWYPDLKRLGVLDFGSLGEKTVDEAFGWDRWRTIWGVSTGILAVLLLLEIFGL